MSALSFGASASVCNFIRVSLALRHLGVQLLKVPWTNFFADYTVSTTDQDVRSCQSAVFLFFQLLGWTVAKDGEKSVPFSQVLHALGVVFHLSKTPDRVIAVSILSLAGHWPRQPSAVLQLCFQGPLA